MHPITTAIAPVVDEAIRAALAPPPTMSTERDLRLLELAIEAGINGHALSLLERIDLAHLSAHDRITYLRQVTACAAWFEAFQTIATAAVAGPTTGWPEGEIDERVGESMADSGGDDLPEAERQALTARVRDEEWQVRERAIALEVSMATRVSTRTAGRRVDSARLLVESLPRALSEAWAGHWGYGHLRVAEKELLDVPAPLREHVLDDVLPHAATDHPRRLTDRLRKSLAKRDAAGMAGRMRERAEQREVTMWNLKDGQARLAITGPYDEVTETMRQLTSLAHARRAAVRATDPDTTYSLNAARFDGFIVAVSRLHRRMVSKEGGGRESTEGDLPEDHRTESAEDGWDLTPAGTPGSRPRAQAAVIVDAATALHLAEEPGYVPGYGWVPTSIAREILADSQAWRRWLLDDATRTIIDAGAVRYRPSEALRDLIAGRDVTCTADTCTRPASETQIDHAVDFDGHNTTPANLHLVCGPDHLAVTAGHFIIDADHEGRALWVSTHSGHAYPSYVDPLHEPPTSESPAHASRPASPDG